MWFMEGVDVRFKKVTFRKVTIHEKCSIACYLLSDRYPLSTIFTSLDLYWFFIESTARNDLRRTERGERREMDRCGNKCICLSYLLTFSGHSLGTGQS